MASVSSRSTVNEPRIARPPIASGAMAATTLPKMITSRISRTGNEIDSARAMFALTSLLMATSVGVAPPDLGGDAVARRPGHGREVRS